jgi:hypothetical protein
MTESAPKRNPHTQLRSGDSQLTFLNSSCRSFHQKYAYLWLYSVNTSSPVRALPQSPMHPPSMSDLVFVTVISSAFCTT